MPKRATSTQVRRIEFIYLDEPLDPPPTGWRMAFTKTVDQVLRHTKTVTRRALNTWENLKAGDRLVAVEKGQGLCKGTKQRVLAVLQVVSVKVVRLEDITQEECAKEGRPDLTPEQFIDFYLERGDWKLNPVMA